MRSFCLILSVLFVTTIEAKGLRYTVDDVYNLVSRIDENLRKEDRMREITQIVRIDATLKNLEKRVNEIADKMESEGDLGRGIPSDLRYDLKVISDRIQKMEDSALSLQSMMSKMDKDLGKLEEMEQKTNRMDKELEHRLTKLMNAISSLHEMNKGLKDQLRNGKGNEGGESTLGSDGILYVTDALENVERKVQEQLSILSMQLRKELDSLKIMASNAFVQCESSDENEEFATEPPKTSVHMDALAYNLSRSQREIREELHLGMQGLEQKMTELASSNAKCAEESRVSGVRSSEAPKCVSDQFDRNAHSCADLRKSGTTCDGIYYVFHPSGRAIRLYCDMTTDGGGWTVIMRRGEFGSAPVSFNQPWRVYKQGFGDMKEEFWLGNDYIHVLTTGNETSQLRIDLESFKSGSRNFTYNSFSIDDENSEYRMHIRGPIGRQSTQFLNYNNRPFVTHDRITDQPEDCAQKYKGGWWYRRHCIYTVLTAERFGNQTTPSMVGMQSQLWREAGILKGAEMKIRPQNFRV